MCVRRLGRAAALMGSRGLEANRLPVAIPLLRGSHANRLSLCSTITIWPRRSSPPALSMTAASMTPSHSKAAAGLAAATIAQLWQETPSVRGLRLRLVSGAAAGVVLGRWQRQQHERRTSPATWLLALCSQEQPGSFTFAPGNWLDLHAPGLQHAVGGYSITSSPQQLRREQGADAGTIDLCVKRSRHPVAEWVHSQAQPGAQVGRSCSPVPPGSSTRQCADARVRCCCQVLLKVGGSFTLPPGVLVGDPLLFIAGGIGITALASMLATLAEQVQPAAAAQRAAAARRPMLLYSGARMQRTCLDACMQLAMLCLLRGGHAQSLVSCT